MAGFQPSPTYDPCLFPSATPGQPPPCPIVDPNLALPAELTQNSIDRSGFSDDVLSFLNQGGSPEILVQAINIYFPFDDRLDYTNDGQQELILYDREMIILGCNPDGSATYKILGVFSDYKGWWNPKILGTEDINKNGFPEIVLISIAYGGLSTALSLTISEWDGQSIQSVVVSTPAYPYRSIADIRGGSIIFEIGSVELQDLDGNGTREIIVHSGISGHPDLLSHGPWRGGTDTFTWNGEAFVLLRSEIDPPVYRFQAVHDADQAILLGEYDKALRLYQEAIFSDKLRGWSPEHSQQQFDIAATWYDGNPTPTPYPASPEEYYHLAAYARFRILVLHALRGNLVEAQTVYDTLQSKFPQGQPGHESALLAQYFWQAFQATQDVGQACNQSLASMGDQTDEIIYWLSGFHGMQSPTYKPVDLCPFGQTGTR